MSPPFFKGVTLVITVLALCFQLANTQPPAHEMLQGATNITFSERPGYYQEFKMNVAASTQECFYERLIEGTSLTCIFQVLSGTDRSLDFTLSSPQGEILDKHKWVQVGSTDLHLRETGVYAFCMNNSLSQFSSKLVYFFISTTTKEKWQKYRTEMKNLDISLHVFKEHFSNVERSISEIKKIQAVVRQHRILDWYTIRSNNALIQTWSLSACFVIVIAGAIQVYFLQHFFAVKDPLTTNKPRP